MTLIFRDCDGLPGRLETLKAVFPGEVIAVTPHHLAMAGAIPITIPDEWLPETGETRARKEWFAADALGLAAIVQLGLDPDFCWFVESDIVGPSAVWRKVFDRTENSMDDGIFAKLLPRDHGFSGMVTSWHMAPPGATHAHLMTLYRLSRRAIRWTLAEAVAQRNFYSEHKTASEIVRRGGTVRDLREFTEYSAPRAFVGHPSGQRFAPGVLNHPVKIAIGTERAD